jgi:hypothetical protein
MFFLPPLFLHTQRYTYVCLCRMIHYTLYIHVYIGVKCVCYVWQISGFRGYAGFVHLKYYTYVYAA